MCKEYNNQILGADISSPNKEFGFYDDDEDEGNTRNHRSISCISAPS